MIEIHVEPVDIGFSFLRILDALLKICVHIKLIYALIFEIVQDLIMDLGVGFADFFVIDIFASDFIFL